jgi:hypothetical protein
LFHLARLAFAAPYFLQINAFFDIFAIELVVTGASRTFLEAQVQQESARLVKGYVRV